MTSLRTLLASAFAICALASLAGCGGSTTDDGPAPPTDSSTDSTKPTDGGDSSVPVDTATDTTLPTDTDVDTSSGETSPPGDVGISCGTTTCFGGDVCCATPKDGGADFVCAKSCPDGGVTIACDSAASCGGTGNYCCAKVESTSGGTPPGCFKAGSASCAKSCATSLPLTGCGSPGQVRLCKTKAECDEPGNANCCTFSAGSFAGSFCVPDLAKTFATGCL